MNKDTFRKYDLFIVIGCIIIVFGLINFVADRFHYAFFNSFWAKPILFGLLIPVIYKMPGYRGYGIRRVRQVLTYAALVISLIQILVMFTAGIFEGFGRSPYSFTPLGITFNVFYVFLPILGMEISRDWLIKKCYKRKLTLTIFLVSVLYTMLLFPFSKITGFTSLQGVVRFVGETVLPSFAESLFASLLVFLGGPIPAILYRGIVQSFLWFCPILPNLQWTTQALINVAFPVIGFTIVQHIYSRAVREVNRSSVKKENPTGWIIISLISVLIIWFPTGLLGVYPTVIISGSMQPGIDIGDMVIVKKAKPEEIKPGDVIQFVRKDKKVVTHRVLEIVKNNNEQCYITKGDANHIKDEPVEFSNLKGRMVGKVPKIGWLSIGIRTMLRDKPDMSGRGVNR